MALTGFLTRTIARVRLFVDEPSTNAKYTDASITDLIEGSWSDTLDEANRNTSVPLAIRHTLSVVDGQQSYILPPTVGMILRLIEVDSATGAVLSEFRPGNRWSPAGPGLLFEGNVLRFEPFWTGGAKTLYLEYVPTGDVRLHNGTAGTITNASGGISCTVILAATPTVGTLDERPNAYAGSMLRFLSASTGVFYAHERVITAYDHTTRTATLTPGFVAAEVPGYAVPAGTPTITYEIAPMLSPQLDLVVALDVAATIAAVEGDAKRAALIEKQYARKMRELRLRQATMENIVGQHFHQG